MNLGDRTPLSDPEGKGIPIEYGFTYDIPHIDENSEITYKEKKDA
jgi:hypothetical protein